MLGGILLGFFAAKKPDIISCELDGRGLRVGTELYQYDTIKSFNIHLGRKPQLLIHSSRIFAPIITVPIEEEDAELIYGLMMENGIPAEDIKPHSSETIMDSLGF